MILDFTVKKIADTIDSYNNPNKVLFIRGNKGMGKTYSVLKYRERHKNCLYFSFMNLDSEFALNVFSNPYPEIFSVPSDWSSFFEQLACYAKKNRLTVIFDHIGDRNDKEEFYSALSAFLETNGNAKIILIGKDWDKISVPYTYTTPKHISTQELADILAISNELSVKLYCLTDGIPSLLEEYITEFTFEDNLADFYKDMCDFWVKSELNHFSHSYVDTENPDYHDVKLDDITFGFSCESYGTNFYIYYNNVPNDKLTSRFWANIEKATTKSSPFYKNEYFICTVNSVPKSYWELSKQYDNVHIIQLKSLFSKFNREYNKRMHPRFVPSFVRYR